MKILEITEFSSGICGVWSRVKQEAESLSKKHDVYIFSSNIEKGTEKIAKQKEILNNLRINRFPSSSKFLTNLLTKNVNYFNFEKSLEALKPDMVITHLIHPHSFKALKVCQKMGIPCYLTTHAPFKIKRSFFLSLASKIYYSLRVKPKLNNFTKIIVITNWEKDSLLKLGCKPEKLVYIPNSIPDTLFKQNIKKFRGKKLLFFGRIAPVKNLETLILAFKSLNKNNLSLTIIGPIEKGYEKIKNHQSKNILFLEPIYNLEEKIKKMQQADIFVLPSKREGMPQSLIEFMALGKIVLSADNFGAKDLIEDGLNGFLFKTGDSADLKEKIEKILSLSPAEISKIQKNARFSVQKFKSSVISKVLEKLIAKK